MIYNREQVLEWKNWTKDSVVGDPLPNGLWNFLVEFALHKNCEATKDNALKILDKWLEKNG